MDPNPIRDKFAKAKIEEPNLNLRLPKEFLKPNGDVPNDRYYIKIFGFLKNFVQFSQNFCCDNTRKSQQVADTVAYSGAKLDRKVYRIRNNELVTVFGDDFEGMSEIHKLSKATIGILNDTEFNLLRHSVLDLVGTSEEIKTAEELILHKVLKTYINLIFPVILMPPIIYGDHINIPLHKVNHVLGEYSTNLLKMEMESGAWIKIEPGVSSYGSKWLVVNVFGPQENIKKAKTLIQSVISEHEEFSSTKELTHVHEEDEDEKEGDESKEKDVEEVFEDKSLKLHGQEFKDVCRILASGCYGLVLQCVSHA